MRRGEVWLVDLQPARPAEADKVRPAVVVSNDGSNQVATRLGRGCVTVVPLTTNVARVYPFQVILPAGGAGLRQDSKAQAEQVRTLSVARLSRCLGMLDAASMARLDAALRVHLSL